MRTCKSDVAVDSRKIHKSKRCERGNCVRERRSLFSPRPPNRRTSEQPVVGTKQPGMGTLEDHVGAGAHRCGCETCGAITCQRPKRGDRACASPIPCNADGAGWCWPRERNPIARCVKYSTELEHANLPQQQTRDTTKSNEGWVVTNAIDWMRKVSTVRRFLDCLCASRCLHPRQTPLVSFAQSV